MNGSDYPILGATAAFMDGEYSLSLVARGCCFGQAQILVASMVQQPWASRGTRSPERSSGPSR